MQLVDVCEFYSEAGGGVRTYIHQKLETGSKLGWDVKIIAPGPENRREKRLGGEIIWVKTPLLPVDKNYHMFHEAKPVHDLLDTLDPDIVEGSSTWRGGWLTAKWQPKAHWRAVKSLFLHQDPVAVYPQSLCSPALPEETVDRMCFWFWWYLRRLSRHFDMTAVSGEWFAKRLTKFGVHRPVAASFGINREAFSPAMRKENVRRAMLSACGIEDPNATLFVTVSRHHMEKRLDMVIDAFAKVSREQPAGLFLIGDGPARNRIRAHANAVKGVHVAGQMSDRNMLATHLASADFMVHGGAAETFGLVVAEALQSGLPIIVPDRGGAADLAHPTYAQTYKAGSARALAEAMTTMMERDSAQVHAAARAGARRLNTPHDHFSELFRHYTNQYNHIHGLTPEPAVSPLMPAKEALA